MEAGARRTAEDDRRGIPRDGLRLCRGAGWPELGAGRLIGPTSSTDAELRFDVAEDVLQRGRLGGAADLEPFRAVFHELFNGIEPGYPTDDVADLDPLPERPERCARVSFGLALEAVAAQRID